MWKLGHFCFYGGFFCARIMHATTPPGISLGSRADLLCQRSLSADETTAATEASLPPHRKLYTQVNRRGKSWVTKAGERREGGRREQTSCPHSPPLIKSCRREWGTENRRKGGRTKTRREGYNIPRIILLSLLFALRYTSWYAVKNLRHPP